MKDTNKYREVELTILTYAGITYRLALETFAAEFRALTGATVRIRSLPEPYGWWDLVSLAQADATSADPQFDMFCDDSNHTWTLWPYLQPLNSFIQRFDYDMSDFFLPVYRDGGSLPAGIRYGLPIRVRVPVIFYRKDLMGEFPATWDEYDKALAAASAGDQYGIAVAGAGYPFHPYGQAYELTKAFLARYWSLGDPILSPDGEPLIHRENGIRALEMLKRQVDLYASPQSWTWDEPAAAKAFLEGTAATLESVPHFLLPYLQDPQRSKVIDRWAVAGYPGEAGGYFTMHEMVMFKRCKNPEAAFEFIAYCTNPASSRRLFNDYAETASRKTPWLVHERAPLLPDLGEIVQALDRGITFAVRRPEWLEMLSALWETIGYHMKGYMTAGVALNLAAEKWKESLNRNREKAKGGSVDAFSTANR